MSARLTLDVFAPLPPAPTDVANCVAGTLPALAARADLRLWVAADAPDPVGPWPDGVALRRWGPAVPDPDALGGSDLAIFHVGNNRTFHGAIERAARAIPGLVVLHDLNLQEFYAPLALRPGPDRALYLDLLANCHGEPARAAGERFARTGDGLPGLIAGCPMTAAPLADALGAVIHNEAGLAAVAAASTVPVLPLPLPFAFGPFAARTPPGEGPLRLVLFGFLGPNRLLGPILAAMATLPDHAARLDIYGCFDAPDDAARLIAASPASARVTVHGFVPTPALDAALRSADLVLNLREPTAGEASGSTLRIWAAAAPSVVTRDGWYATLPEDCVRFVDPGDAASGLARLLEELRRDRDALAPLGLNGRARLERLHAPDAYADALLAIAADVDTLRLGAVGRALARRVAPMLDDGAFVSELAERISSSLLPAG